MFQVHICGWLEVLFSNKMKKKFSFICAFVAGGLLLATVAAAFAGFKNRTNANLNTSDRAVFSAKDQANNANDALCKYTKACNTDEKLAIFNSLSSISDRKIVELVYKALEDPADEVRIAAAQLLVRFEADTAIPAISKALNDRNEEVRIIAVQALDETNVPETAKLLAGATRDESEDVRYAVFSIAFTKDVPTREAILKEAVGSQYQDVKERLIDLAVETPSHMTVDTLLLALKDGDKEQGNRIFAVLEVFFSEEFKTCDDARNWWTKNRDRFDKELVLK